MKRNLSNFIIFFLVLGIISISFNINTYAYENSTKANETNSNFEQLLDSVSLTDIKSYFQNSIEELKAQKEKSTSIEHKKSIDNEIKTYSNILDTIKNKNLTEKDINDGKNLIRSKNKATKEKSLSTNSQVTLDSASTSFNQIYVSILTIIAVGNKQGYTLSARLLAHSLDASTGSTYEIWNNDSIIDSRVKASRYYQDELRALQSSYKRSGQINGFTESFGIVFDGKDTIVEKDMYNSLHGLNGGGSVTINNGYGELVMNDIYDFPPFQWPSSPTDFTTMLNDIGRNAQEAGVCHIYYVKIHTVEPFYNYIPTPSTSSYVPYYNLKFQQFYNQATKTTSPIAEDGIYGPQTENAYKTLGRLLTGTYNNEPPSNYVPYYNLKFQQFYNQATKTTSPISEDGIYGPQTAKAYETLGRLLTGTY